LIRHPNPHDLHESVLFLDDDDELLFDPNPFLGDSQQ
jgi:hypothetical protein